VTTFSSARLGGRQCAQLQASRTGEVAARARADGRAATLIPELNNLRTAINNQSRLIGSLNIARTDSPDTREDHDPAFPPNAGMPVGGTP
jgi:hypothetical protein